jgi:hypothetical protein
MRREWLASLGAVGLLILYMALYLLQPGGPDILKMVSGALYAGFALLAAALAIRAGFAFDAGTPQRRAWVLLSMGMAVSLAANCLWASYQLSQAGPAPAPSPADVLWLLGYALLAAGMLIYYRPLSASASRRRKAIALAGYFVLFVVATVVVVPPLMAHPIRAGTIGLLLNVLYPIADLSLALIATLSLLVLCGGLVGRPWRSIMISALLLALADLLYAYGMSHQIYSVGHNLLSAIVDTAYLFGYAEAAMGGYWQVTLSLPPAEG